MQRPCRLAQGRRAGASWPRQGPRRARSGRHCGGPRHRSARAGRGYAGGPGARDRPRSGVRTARRSGPPGPRRARSRPPARPGRGCSTAVVSESVASARSARSSPSTTTRSRPSTPGVPTSARIGRRGAPTGCRSARIAHLGARIGRGGAGGVPRGARGGRQRSEGGGHLGGRVEDPARDLVGIDPVGPIVQSARGCRPPRPRERPARRSRRAAPRAARGCARRARPFAAGASARPGGRHASGAGVPIPGRRTCAAWAPVVGPSAAGVIGGCSLIFIAAPLIGFSVGSRRHGVADLSGDQWRRPIWTASPRVSSWMDRALAFSPSDRWYADQLGHRRRQVDVAALERALADRAPVAAAGRGWRTRPAAGQERPAASLEAALRPGHDGDPLPGPGHRAVGCHGERGRAARDHDRPAVRAEDRLAGLRRERCPRRRSRSRPRGVRDPGTRSGPRTGPRRRSRGRSGTPVVSSGPGARSSVGPTGMTPVASDPEPAAGEDRTARARSPTAWSATALKPGVFTLAMLSATTAWRVGARRSARRPRCRSRGSCPCPPPAEPAR